MRLILPLLVLSGCAKSACEQFLDAKAACYEKAGIADDAEATYCADHGAQDDPPAIESLYDCYAAAYSDSDCASEADVAAAGAVASQCSLEGN